jgi:hypothetical protein
MIPASVALSVVAGALFWNVSKHSWKAFKMSTRRGKVLHVVIAVTTACTTVAVLAAL